MAWDGLAPRGYPDAISYFWPYLDTVGEFRSSGESSVLRVTGSGERLSLKPGRESYQVHGGGSGDVLEMGLRQPVVARLAELERANSLREGALDASTGGVLRLERRSGLTLTCISDGLMLRLRANA